MITSIADVSCTPIGPPLLKSRPPLQTQVSNTTNIRVPDRETKKPERLINTTNEWRLVQGYETPLREKRDEDVSSELDNGS
ncbi:hypothetical protein TNCV_3438761 [Trichonephila clavipes]|nr:hypothetical protein TNCV_3438761 [Trichonephila clavipes]